MSTFSDVETMSIGTQLLACKYMLMSMQIYANDIQSSLFFLSVDVLQTLHYLQRIFYQLV